MPVEFVRETCTAYGHYTVCDSTKLVMAYDGSGRRISKTRMKKTAFDGPWYATLVTHYTGIGSEIRKGFHNGTREKVNVVVNMPVFFRVTLTRLKPQSYIEKDILRLSNGGAILPKRSFGASRQSLVRYKVADASQPADDNASRTFEWYLKNHLDSTMLVYGTVASTDPNTADIGEVKAAYDYRAFGEQVELMPPDLAKVTENFTGKEFDEEIKLDYFGARYLDPMLGMWTSVDPKRQFASPYLYAGNGVNPVNGTDGDGNYYEDEYGRTNQDYNYVIPDFQEKVSVEDMDAILSAHETLQGQLGLLDYILPSYALKSYMYDREIAFSLNDVSEYTVGDQTSVATENLGKNVFHLHSFRYNGSKEGFSSNDYVMCNYYCRSDFMMEITSGNVYFQNVNANNREYPGVKQNLYGIGKEFLLMNIPLPNYTPNR